MSPFILDSSVALSWVFEDEFDAYSEFVISRFDGSQVHVPSLWWLEVFNTLLLAERKGRLSPESFAKAYAEVSTLSGSSRSLGMSVGLATLGSLHGDTR